MQFQFQTGPFSKASERVNAIKFDSTIAMHRSIKMLIFSLYVIFRCFRSFVLIICLFQGFILIATATCAVIVPTTLFSLNFAKNQEPYFTSIKFSQPSVIWKLPSSLQRWLNKQRFASSFTVRSSSWKKCVMFAGINTASTFIERTALTSIYTSSVP